jgi:hypothetical protein
VARDRLTADWHRADHRQVEYVMQKMSVVQSLHDGLLSSIASVQSKADQGTR